MKKIISQNNLVMKKKLKKKNLPVKNNFSIKKVGVAQENERNGSAKEIVSL